MDAEGTEPTLKPQLPRGKQFNRISTAAQAHAEMPFETAFVEAENYNIAIF